MSEFTVFYCWQNANPRANRHFVRECLDSAAEAVSTSGILVKIDQDTEDVSGSPIIAETILQKIRGVDAVIGDFSIVARTSGGQAVPNANVMLEVGYAIRCHEWDRVSGVFNLACGKVENLPFDLKHRRSVVAYRLRGDDPDDARAEARESLVAALEDVIRGWLTDGKSKALAELENQRILLSRELQRLHDHADALTRLCAHRALGRPFDLAHFEELRRQLMPLTAQHYFLDDHLAEFRGAAAEVNNILRVANPSRFTEFAVLAEFCERARDEAHAAQFNLQNLGPS